MKLFIIAGEDSGDLHASNLIKSLHQTHPDLQVRGVGGDKMAEQQTSLIAHIKDINFMGFWEVIKNLGTIRKLFRTVKEDILNWKPDAVVLVDYPGFNLRMAKFIKGLELPVIFYISPQLWAWKKGRIKTIRKFVDRMMVILPFEKTFYGNEGVEVDFVGHPLLDVIAENEDSPISKPIVALLPGSRQQEIKRMLPVMLSLPTKFPDYEFVVAGAPSQEASFYHELIGDAPVSLVMDETYALLHKASYALVTSGTATLETGLHKVPQIVCYSGSPISYAIGKRLVQVKYISLVNLILDQPLVKELIQYEFNPDNLEKELATLMKREETERVMEGYTKLRTKLGNVGASARAAEIVSKYLSQQAPTEAISS